MDTRIYFLTYLTMFLHMSYCTGSRVMMRPPWDSDHIYLTFYGVTNLLWCTDECNARPFCTGIQFSHRRRVCHLLDGGDVSNRPLKEKIATRLKDNPAPVCGNCTANEVCNEHSLLCEIKECDIKHSYTQSKYKGNMRSIGRNIQHICTSGFIFPDGQSKHTLMCSADGSWTGEQQCRIATCDFIGKVTSVSGAYETFDTLSRQVFQIWCDFKDGHGYTYIPSYAINDFSDISRYYTRTDQVMIRYRMASGAEYEGEVSLIPEYSGNGNITVVVNNIYNNHQNESTNGVIVSNYPSIQLDIPRLDPHQTTSGYVINGNPILFEMADDKLHGFAVSAGSDLDSRMVYCYYTNFYNNCVWNDFITPISSNYFLPNGYFFNFYFMIGNDKMFFFEYWSLMQSRTIEGLNFGLRFDMT